MGGPFAVCGARLAWKRREDKRWRVQRHAPMVGPNEGGAMIRIFWGSVGGISVGLGVAGVVLPLVPTTPFMLLAAYCFARSSPKLERWLLEHPRFGPSIADWRAHRAISGRGKRLAVLAIGLTFALSVVLRLPGSVLAVQAVVLSAVSLFILTRPTAPARPAPGPAPQPAPHS